MPKPYDDHNNGWYAQNKVKYEVSCELCQEVCGCPKTCLNPKQVSSLTSMVVYLLKQKDSSNTDEYKVLKSFVGHIHSANVGYFVNNCLLKSYIHCHKHKQGNDD